MRAERSARVFQRRKKAQKLANRNYTQILTKINRSFFPVCDISTFKRYFHCILRAERSARVFQRRNKPTHTQIGIIRVF